MLRRVLHCIAFSVLILVSTLLARPSTVSAQGTSLCGWIESTPKPTLFVNITEGLIRSYGLTEDNFNEADLWEIQGRFWTIDLDHLSDEDFAHYEQVTLLEPGYYNVYDPDFFPFSQSSSLRSYSWLERVSACEYIGPTITPLPIPTAARGGYICGKLTFVRLPFKYMFVPDGVKSSDPVQSSWAIDDNFWSASTGTIELQSLEDKYLRIWMPDIDYNGGELWGYTVPLLKSVADYEVIPRCNDAPTPPPTPVPPTATRRPTNTPRPPTATPVRPTATIRPPNVMPTPIPTSPINHILTAANVPWATQCIDASTACLPYRLSVSDLPKDWQSHAIQAATLWADAVPQLQFTLDSVDDSARTLEPQGTQDWMVGQTLGKLRLAVGEIRIVPESAIAPHKLESGYQAMGIAYTDQTRLRQAVAGLIIVKENPSWPLYWGLDGKPSRGKLDLQTLLAHELGHIFGICGHDMNPTCNSQTTPIPNAAIMYSYENNLIGILSGGLPRRELHAIDIEVMTKLYPPSSQ